MKEFRTDLVFDNDKTDWRFLYEGYAEFFGVVINDGIADRVWN
jgi:hypothetical protein